MYRLFSTIHRNNQNNKNNDTTYWQFYRFRNLDQIKRLEALFSQINAQAGGVQVASTVTTQYSTQTKTNTITSPRANYGQSQSQNGQEQPIQKEFGSLQKQRSEVPAGSFLVDKREYQPRSATTLQNTKGPFKLESFEEFIELAHVIGIKWINAKDLVKFLKPQLSDQLSLTLDHFVNMFAEVFKGKYKNYNQFKDQLTSIFNYLDVNGKY